VTPFISHLKSVASSPRDIVLVYAVSDPKEIAYKDLLEESGARVVIVSPVKPDTLPKNWSYASDARINYEKLPELIPDISSRWAYASGPEPFVYGAKHNLRKLGVRSVKTDFFAGY